MSFNLLIKTKYILFEILSKFSSRINYSVGLSHIANMRNKYDGIKRLHELEYKVYSQNGEDGIIDYLLYSLKIIKPKFIEIGVGDYSECNTRFVFERTSCQGLIIDVIKNLKQKVRKNINLWRGDLTITEKEINSENFFNVLEEKNFIKDIDLFSIDIDGIDYWVLEKLPNEFSKILVAEYNAYFGDKLMISVPNIEGFQEKNITIHIYVMVFL